MIRRGRKARPKALGVLLKIPCIQFSIGVVKPVFERETIAAGNAKLGASASVFFPPNASREVVKGEIFPEKRAIYERHSHFQRMRHARPVCVAQELIAHIERRLER